MHRDEVIAYVEATYAVSPEYPWARTPNYAILRHGHNRKWFAAIMDITEDKLGLPGSKLVDAVNLKCGPLMAGSLRSKPGIFKAYHMNKEHWVTVLLDGTLPHDEVCSLIDLSYELTK